VTLRRTLCIVLAAAALGAAGAALGQGADLVAYKRIGGYAIFLGVVPAEILLGRIEVPEQGRMHGGAPGRHLAHHVLVGLFDDATDFRIGDAAITAQVSAPGTATQTTRLEPMCLHGSVSYGNWFEIRHSTCYRIDLAIRRGASPDAQPVEAFFEYAHPHWGELPGPRAPK
jgi:hypothetical protein